PILNAESRCRPLQWTRLDQRWTLQRWRSVPFTDESKICLDKSDKRRLVWKSRGERFRDCGIQKQNKWGVASIMVWGGTSYNSKSPLLVIEEI
ncbi:hypothetical protein CAPTEDRAFT_137069, partial [Capitella teleta]